MNLRFKKNSNAGFTLLEFLISTGIFSLLALAAAWILITSLRSNAILWEQLATQTDGKKTLQEVVDVVRRAEQSSTGAYSIEKAEDYELVVYANVDTDANREKVRFYVDTANNKLYMGTTKPSGNPLTYNPANETTRLLASDLVNDDNSVPVFSYFDTFYTGTQTPLAQPITSITDIRVVRVQLELEKDPNATPVPLHVESTVQIRNLKSN
jgi:prepilin-type N-terminal cleavage/methylation domain-containing protein